VSKANFLSIQIDGSTDSANVDLVLYFNPHSKDGKVHVCDNFLAISSVKLDLEDWDSNSRATDWPNSVLMSKQN